MLLPLLAAVFLTVAPAQGDANPERVGDTRQRVGIESAKPAPPVPNNEISPTSPAGKIAAQSVQTFSEEVQGSKAWPEYPIRPPSKAIHNIADVLNKFPLIAMLFYAMFADVLVGICVAFGKKTVSSNLSRVGAMRKAATLIIVAVAAAIEPYSGLPIAKGVTSFFLVTEFLSLLEGAAALGVPIPRQLFDALEKLRRNTDKGMAQVIVAQTPQPGPGPINSTLITAKAVHVHTSNGATVMPVESEQRTDAINANTVATRDNSAALRATPEKLAEPVPVV